MSVRGEGELSITVDSRPTEMSSTRTSTAEGVDVVLFTTVTNPRTHEMRFPFCDFPAYLDFYS